MSIQILFLIAFAFFAGKCTSLRAMSVGGRIGYFAAITLGGVLFYYAPIIYVAVAILATCIIAGLFALAGSDDPRLNSSFRINFTLQTLFFWPINLYDLVYLGLKMKPDNNDI